MTQRRSIAGAVLALAAGVAALMPGAVLAQRAPTSATSTTFDCSKASGEVEQLICKDAALAALDRELDRVYKAALAKARDGLAATVRTEQRGWISGRNECWKATAPTFITASWQVATVRDCVDANYRVRISELQAQWQLAPAKPPVFYTCANNPANEVVVTFFDTDPPAARVERGDSTVTAWEVRSASGARYEGQNVEFWTKGKDAAVTWRGETLQCTAR